MTDSHGTRQKRPSTTLPLSIFLIFNHPLFLGETNSFCQSLRINNVYWQIADCVRKDKTVWAKYAKTELHLDSCVMSQKAAYCEKEQAVWRREPPRHSGEGTLRVCAMLAHTLTSSQPFKMPYHNHTSVKKETECIICERQSRALNLDWLTEQQTMPYVFRMYEGLIMNAVPNPGCNG